MNYNIVAVYATNNGNEAASTLCECESDKEAAVAAFKWVLNRWGIWREVCDVKEIISIRVRQYPIRRPSQDGFIQSGDALPFLDWTEKATNCPKDIREEIKPFVAAVKSLKRQ